MSKYVSTLVRCPAASDSARQTSGCPPTDSHPTQAASSEQLLHILYDELRQLAARKMAGERAGHTLQATALVHEAYLRLAQSGAQPWQNRAHFFAAAAEAMRRILVEHARRKQSLKRGGGFERLDADVVELPLPIRDDDLIALDEAIDRLDSVDARAAQVVKLCFFIGLTQEEAAAELGVSLSTAERLWSFARAWLLREIRRQPR